MIYLFFTLLFMIVLIAAYLLAKRKTSKKKALEFSKKFDEHVICNPMKYGAVNTDDSSKSKPSSHKAHSHGLTGYIHSRGIKEGSVNSDTNNQLLYTTTLLAVSSIDSDNSGTSSYSTGCSGSNGGSYGGSSNSSDYSSSSCDSSSSYSSSSNSSSSSSDW